ncbi:MAG: SUMF1/EgtB/PvdO family nonheme iron enzyme [Deltaproteobacteria bacterium]|nr:SUMF1/EgtB/PvdO family nonheme iron enzyme [Deltaproteobacteria bacterium]
MTGALVITAISAALAAVPVGMVGVPGGSFVFGRTDGDPDEAPARRRTLRPFFIDRFEVNQAQYADCVRRGLCRPARRYPNLRDPRLPAVGVNYYDAQRYCRQRGARLPTEAEWERVATVGGKRPYPWGHQLDCQKANYGNFSGNGPCAPDKNPGRITPVGSYPMGNSPSGVADLIGNVWEWVADGYDGTALRVVRGGSCCSIFLRMHAGNRHRFDPSRREADLGFRCAADAVGEPTVQKEQLW